MGGGTLDSHDFRMVKQLNEWCFSMSIVGPFRQIKGGPNLFRSKQVDPTLCKGIFQGPPTVGPPLW